MVRRLFFFLLLFILKALVERKLLFLQFLKANLNDRFLADGRQEKQSNWLPLTLTLAVYNSLVRPMWLNRLTV